MERELEQAVRARAEIAVVVRMPDGSQRTFTLEASGWGGGRMEGIAGAAFSAYVRRVISVRPAQASSAAPA